jgi:hypothetical protein
MRSASALENRVWSLYISALVGQAVSPAGAGCKPAFTGDTTVERPFKAAMAFMPTFSSSVARHWRMSTHLDIKSSRQE